MTQKLNNVPLESLLDWLKDPALSPTQADSLLSECRTCIGQGADIDRQNDRRQTALILAAYHGREDHVAWLLDQGADIHAKDIEGRTALTEVCRTGKGDFPGIVNRLISGGAQPDEIDNSQRAAISYAALAGKVKTVEALLKRGAQCKAIPSGLDTITPPLMHAATNGNPRIIKLLLAHGADPNEKGYKDSTALIFAARNGREQAAAALLEAGANVNIIDEYGKTPLFYAAEKGWDKLAALLLEKGAQIGLKGPFSSDLPIQRAIENGHLEIVDLFLRNDADPDQTVGTYGDPLITYAGRHKQFAIVKLLENYGANLNSPNEWMQEPITTSIKENSPDLLMFLLEHGVDPYKKRNFRQKGLLTEAVEKNQWPSIIFLGVSCDLLDQKDDRGKKASDIAKERNNPMLVELLEFIPTLLQHKTQPQAAYEAMKPFMVKAVLEMGTDFQKKLQASLFQKDDKGDVHWSNQMQSCFSLRETLRERYAVSTPQIPPPSPGYD